MQMTRSLRSLPVVLALGGLTALSACSNSSTKPSGEPNTDQGQGGASDGQAGDQGGADPDGTGGTTDPGHVPDANADIPLPPWSYASGCSIPDAPPETGSVGWEPAFPSLSFQAPVDLTHAGDGTDRLFVVEQPGRIRVFPNNDAVSVDQVSLFLDITDRVDYGGERGLLGVAFHPNYKDNGYFYVNYSDDSGGDTRVSRFSVKADDPNQADPASELVLLEIDQPYGNHNGGGVEFGPDGYLYIGVGDGGSGGDPQNNAQNRKNLLGNILRIDVDSTTDDLAYGIPPDNPWADGSTAARREIYAWGLRNPWGFSFDRVTGDLWLADVGQNAIEEINIIESGKNYGWRLMEASQCFNPSNCDPAGLVLPVAEYPHSVGKSVTGGFVYRGTKVPSLYGAYLYADYVSQVLFAFRYGEEAAPSQPLFDGVGNVSSFGEDEAGEVYFVKHKGSGSSIRRFVEVTNPTPVDFPTTLTATGCFSDVAKLEAAPGVAPYDVNAPLWSDGAAKRRWLVLPEGGKIGFSPEGRWTFPTGTLFIKHFEMEVAPGQTERLETRFLKKTAEGVRGYTYVWNDAGTEATLQGPSGKTRRLDVQVGGQVESRDWQFPSRGQCFACHTPASGGILGLETRQQNKMATIGGKPRNLLATYQEWGLFDPPLDKAPEQYPAFADPYSPTAAASDRARAWLHSNCAGCHLPDGPSGVTLDLRYDTALDAMEACEKDPIRGDLGVAGLKLIDPGNADNSGVYRRLLGGAGRMPPLASAIPDHPAAAAVEAWIDGLGGCTPQ